jgi:aspartate/methionine/tyrosine aminotransferase
MAGEGAGDEFPGHFRVCFTVGSLEDVTEGLERLAAYVASYQG